MANILETLVLKYLVLVSHLMIATCPRAFTPWAFTCLTSLPQKGSMELGRSQVTKAKLTSQGT